MTALEQSMKDFNAAHGLVHFSLSFSSYPADQYGEGRSYFNASAQWLDPSKEHGRGIATGRGDTIAEAIANMVVVMVDRRGANALADEPLPQVAA